MAPRPYWKGYLKLSLVSCPIALYSAASATEKVSFRQINKKTGNRLRQQLVDEVTRQPVEAADKGRGYEVDEGQFIPVEDEELEAIQVESSHSIVLDQFVPRAEIDNRYFDSPYYIVPNDEVGQEAFAVIREAMRKDGMVGIGRVVLNKRERMIAIQAHGRGLIGTTLRFAYEVRKEDAYFDEIGEVKVDGEMLQLAKHIIDKKTGSFDPSDMEDHYETALVELLKKKQKGFKPKAGGKVANAPTNVINLMDALRKSIKDDVRPAAAKKKNAVKKGHAA
jgi:DNA end-binding protein Ku